MSLSDKYLTIDTPENVAFGYDVAGIGSRFLATMVDTLLIIILMVIVNVASLFLTTILLGSNWVDEAVVVWVGAILGLISFGLFWGYYIVFEMMWNGQSPGKRWVGLRVLKLDGTPITLVESVVRNLIRLIDFLPFYYGFGVVTMFINEQSRRLGDLAAGTLVVYDTGAITLDELSQDSMIPGLRAQAISPDTEQLPVERLTAQDMAMIEDYLRRRFDLANRFDVAAKISERLHAQMQVPDPGLHGAQADELLAEIYKFAKLRASRRS